MFQKCGEIKLQIENPPSFVYLAASSVTSNGVTTSSDGEVYFFDSNEGKIIYNFHAHDAGIMGVCMSERSQIIGTCCNDEGKDGNSISLWDMRAAQNIANFNLAAYDNQSTTCNCIAMNKTGRIVSAGSNNGVLSWDARKPEGLFRLISIQPEEISSIEFHPLTDSSFLAGDDDGNILLYDLDGLNEEDSVLFYANDSHPVFHCGFCGVDTIFTLRRTAGL